MFVCGEVDRIGSKLAGTMKYQASAHRPKHVFQARAELCKEFAIFWNRRRHTRVHQGPLGSTAQLFPSWFPM